MWIRRIARRHAGQAHLVPVRVGLAPKDRAPGPVELIQAAVPLLEPRPKGCLIGVRIEDADLAVELVVDLPAGDGRVVSVMFGHPADDPRRQLAVDRRVVVVVAAPSLLGADAPTG